MSKLHLSSIYLRHRFQSQCRLRLPERIDANLSPSVWTRHKSLILLCTHKIYMVTSLKSIWGTQPPCKMLKKRLPVNTIYSANKYSQKCIWQRRSRVWTCYIPVSKWLYHVGVGCMLGAQLQVSHKLFTFLHTKNIEMRVLGNNMNQGKRWNDIRNIMGRKKSKPQLNASPPLLPNQRTNRSPLNSSNYLKDNQRLFTRQSRRKKTLHIQTHISFQHTCTRPHTNIMTECCSQHVSPSSWHAFSAIQLYKNMSIWRAKSKKRTTHQKILTTVVPSPAPRFSQILTPALVEGKHP